MKIAIAERDGAVRSILQGSQASQGDEIIEIRGEQDFLAALRGDPRES